LLNPKLSILPVPFGAPYKLAFPVYRREKISREKSKKSTVDFGGLPGIHFILARANVASNGAERRRAHLRQLQPVMRPYEFSAECY